MIGGQIRRVGEVVFFHQPDLYFKKADDHLIFFIHILQVNIRTVEYLSLLNSIDRKTNNGW